MKKDLRLLALLPFAVLGDLLLTLAETVDAHFADALNPEDER